MKTSPRTSSVFTPCGVSGSVVVVVVEVVVVVVAGIVVASSVLRGTDVVVDILGLAVVAGWLLAGMERVSIS